MPARPVSATHWMPMSIYYVSFSDTYGLLHGRDRAPEMYRTGRKLPDEQQTKGGL
jgi:hypothetical protein